MSGHICHYVQAEGGKLQKMRCFEARIGKNSEGRLWAPKFDSDVKEQGRGLFSDTPSTDAEPQLLKQLNSVRPKSVPKKSQDRACGAGFLTFEQLGVEDTLSASLEPRGTRSHQWAVCTQLRDWGPNRGKLKLSYKFHVKQEKLWTSWIENLYGI